MAEFCMKRKIYLYFLIILISSVNKNAASGVIVKLFEWGWEDVAKECEDFLAPNGFAAVEVSPPSEHRIIGNSFHQAEIVRPWIERYQIVSYKLVSRSGNETQFANMVERCNQVGVRIFVEAVINHMTSPYGHGLGIGSTPYSGTSKVYEGVPYFADSFHGEKDCPTKDQVILNSSDPIQVRNCRLMGFLDLDQSKESVRKSIVGYFNHLIHLGVSGFRIHAANHIWPKDLHWIINKIIPLSVKYFPPSSKAFIYHEISSFPLADSVNEYLELGKITEFYYSVFIGKMLRRELFELSNLRDISNDDLHTTPSKKAIVFLDHQNLQRMTIEDTVTFRDGKLFLLGNIILLTFPYGQPIIMSSYYWIRQIEHNQDHNNWVGPPTNDYYETLPVIRFLNHSCGNGWVCEHRDGIIRKLVSFYNMVGNESLNKWWDDSENQIAFSRGDKGFVVINNGFGDIINITLQTGLLSGKYCDIISGELIDNSCTGKVIYVNQVGDVAITIFANDNIPAIVIHKLTKIIQQKSKKEEGNESLKRDNSIDNNIRTTSKYADDKNNAKNRDTNSKTQETHLNHKALNSAYYFKNLSNHRLIYLFIAIIGNIFL